MERGRSEGIMPKVTANNCEMFYEINDYTDPWVPEKETVW